MRTMHTWLAVAVVACAGTSTALARDFPCTPGDQTAALNEALAAGGDVALGPGTCLVSGTILVPSNTALTGAGIGASIIRAAPGASYPTLSIGGQRLADASHDVDVSALTVDGGAIAAGPRRSDGILVPFGSTRVRLRDLEVTGGGDNGIEANGSGIEISDNLVRDNFHNGIYVTGKGNRGGLHVARATAVRVLRNTVRHNSRAKAPGSGHAWDGIDIDPITQDVVVQGNTVIGNDIILFESGDVVASSGGHKVIDNLVRDSPGNGVVVQGRITDFEISGNRVERIIGWGIIVNGPARRGMVRGNVVRGATREAVLIRNTTPYPGAPDGIEVSGNTITPGPSGPARTAVAVRHGATGIRITGNSFPPDAVDARSAASDLVVRDNR